jgi:hypothetical protein
MKYMYPSFTVPAHGVPKVDKPEPPCPVCAPANRRTQVWRVCALHRESLANES